MMNHIDAILIGWGFLFIFFGVLIWSQTHVIEKHTETERYYYVDGDGLVTRYEISPELLKGYKIVKRNLAP